MDIDIGAGPYMEHDDQLRSRSRSHVYLHGKDSGVFWRSPGGVV